MNLLPQIVTSYRFQLVTFQNVTNLQHVKQIFCIETANRKQMFTLNTELVVSLPHFSEDKH